MDKLGGRLVLALIAAAVAVAGVVGADDGRAFTADEPLEFTTEGDFNPKTLSKTMLTPIRIQAVGRLEPGSDPFLYPPALRRVKVDAGKDVAFDARGYPACDRSLLSGETSTSDALANCRDAMVGRGTVGIEIMLAGEKVLPLTSKLLVFSGGAREGVTTLYIHAYVTVPVPAAIVSTVKIRRIHRGPYGIRATVTIPKITGGSGSITSFELELGKEFAHKGKRVSVLSARCRDGELQARVQMHFADDTNLSGLIAHHCKSRD